MHCSTVAVKQKRTNYTSAYLLSFDISVLKRVYCLSIFTCLPIIVNYKITISFSVSRLSGIFDSISQVAKFTRRWDDDFVESINHRWSCLILVVMTVVVSLKQYAGEPIVCWCEGIWSGM